MKYILLAIVAIISCQMLWSYFGSPYYWPFYITMFIGIVLGIGVEKITRI